uniref:Helicase ATP-binding domain-containing protein n=1 Tax=Corethron hystrix TaxID=216773 RepID=A0A7S1FWE5_9STRA
MATLAKQDQENARWVAAKLKEQIILKGKLSKKNTKNMSVTDKKALQNQLEKTRIMLSGGRVTMQEYRSQMKTAQQHLSTLRDIHKKFMISSEQFVRKAKTMLQGELVGTVPRCFFTRLKEVVDHTDGFLPLKSHYAKALKGYHNKKLTDIRVFQKFSNALAETQSLCNRTNDISAKIATDEQNVDRAWGCLENFMRTQEDLRHKIDVISKDVTEIKEQIESQEKILSEMYCQQEVDRLEKQLEDTRYEDSIHVGKAHLHRVLNSIKKIWAAKLDGCWTDGDLKSYICVSHDEILRKCKTEHDRVTKRLPIYDRRAEILNALASSDVVIIIAGTGCGKSTQVPQYVTDDLYYIRKTHPVCDDSREVVRICCTQPRRMAAQSIAKRVSQEYQTGLGGKVGYRVGMRGSLVESQKISKETIIEFVTEGWLLFQLTKSPEKLYNYDCIIVDEVHERNVETDLLLALLKKAVENESKRFLKVVIMSATINHTQIQTYFNKCPVVDCPGKIHKVEEFYCPTSDGNQEGLDVSHAVNILFEKILKKFGAGDHYEDGDCLIFLSGSQQIIECVDKINKRARESGTPYAVAYPLFAQMDEKDKSAAINQSHRTGLAHVTDGKHQYSRKIICCTNIAETSLTVHGIRFVIEGGYAKKSSYDHHIRCKSLSEKRVSEASAHQRRGRAGRTAPGRCYYLYSQKVKDQMEKYERPKILETPVEKLILYCLQVHKTSIENLSLLDCPDILFISAAKDRLMHLGMIEETKDSHDAIQPTKDGHVAIQLSMIDPQSVRMILSSQKPDLLCFDDAVKLGVILSYEDDIFLRKRKEDYEEEDKQVNDLGDHFLILKYFEAFEKIRISKSKKQEKVLRLWCKDNGIIFYSFMNIQRTIEQCYRLIKTNHFVTKYTTIDNVITSLPSQNQRLLGALISGYFSQIVECVDPTLIAKIGFMPLLPSSGTLSKETPKKTIPMKLDRDSCIQDILTEESDIDFIFDDDDNKSNGVESELMENICDDGSISSKDIARSSTVSFNYIIHGLLTGLERQDNYLVFIQYASILYDGRLIKQYAPQSWLDSVHFDPNKPSICKQTLVHVGLSYIRLAMAFYRLNKLDEKDVNIHILWNKCTVILYGSQESTEFASGMLAKTIEMEQEKTIKKDFRHHYPNRDFFCFSQYGLVKFGCGFEVKDIDNKDGSGKKISLFDWFSGSRPTHWRKESISQSKPWRKKVDRKKMVVTFFINQGNSNIFFKNCTLLFPSNLCSYTVSQGKVMISFLEETKRIVKQDQKKGITICYVFSVQE